MDSKLKAVFSPRLRPGGNKTVLNTMFVYFTAGGCHYLRKKKKIKKGFASDFNDFPVFQHDFRTFIFGEVLIFQDYFIPCQCAGSLGEEESCQNFWPCFGGTCKEFYHPSLVFLVNNQKVLSHSKSRSINCSCWPLPGQTWGMFFISQGQSLNLSSIGIFFFDVSLS